MKVQFTVRLDEEIKDMLTDICDKDKRSQSNMISLLIEQAYYDKVIKKEEKENVPRPGYREITD